MAKQTKRTSVGIDAEPQLFINSWHSTLGIDESYIGLNVYQMSDLNLLIEWWNITVRYMSNLVDGKSSKEKELSYLQAALWIRINKLHPKYVLKFADITFKQVA